MARLSQEERAGCHASVVKVLRLTTFMLLIFVTVAVLPAVAQIELPTDPNLTCKVSTGINPPISDTAEFNTWFHSGAAALNGVVDPADSVHFPNVPNCSFYQWSQRMFLWLTSPAPASYGGGGGRIFASPAFFTVSPPDPTTFERTLIPNPARGPLKFNLRAAQAGVHGLPVIMSKNGQMFEVQPATLSASGKPLVLNSAGKQVEVAKTTLQNGKLVLMDSAGKPIQAPKLIVPKQITLQQLRMLHPEPAELKAPANQPEMMMNKPAPPPAQLKATAAEQAQLKALASHPIDSKLIAQKFMVNGKTIFLNTSGGQIDVEQGQADDGVLIAQNGSLIYYVTMVNDVYAYFLTGTKNGGITPAPTQFPTNGNDLAKIVNFAQTSKGVTFPDPNALAIEVKSAWIETTGITNPGDYITTQAIIPTYDRTNPSQWVPNGQKTTTLALVGMHVVGSASGHPEMIWSTFEHFGNAPNSNFSYNSTSGPKTINQANPITGAWLFCATGSTGPFNREKAMFQSPNIVPVSSTVPMGPSDIIRFKPFGAASTNNSVGPNPGHNEAASNTEIISIDNNVMSLMNAAGASTDVREKYYMTGSTWTINGGAFTPGIGNFGKGTINVPPPTLIDNSGIVTGRAVGTSQIANTTMETFQQIDTSWSNTSNNCFSCHQGNTTGVSHVFFATKKLF